MDGGRDRGGGAATEMWRSCLLTQARKIATSRASAVEGRLPAVIAAELAAVAVLPAWTPTQTAFRRVVPW